MLIFYITGRRTAKDNETRKQINSKMPLYSLHKPRKQRKRNGLHDGGLKLYQQMQSLEGQEVEMRMKPSQQQKIPIYS